MAWTIFARNPETGARGVLIEVEPDLGDVAVARRAREADVAALRRRLFDRNIRVGLRVSPYEVLVLRDRLTSMSFEGNDYARYTIDTSLLFEAADVGKPSATELIDQVRSWLSVLAESWSEHLPAEAYEAFVPDVVGHLVRADIEVHEGLLPLLSAAE